MDLPDDDRCMVDLLLRDRHFALRSLTDARTVDGCVFTAMRSASFRRWLNAWILQLLHRCPPGVRGDIAAHFVRWQACRPSARRPCTGAQVQVIESGAAASHSLGLCLSTPQCIEGVALRTFRLARLQASSRPC